MIDGGRGRKSRGLIWSLHLNNKMPQCYRKHMINVPKTLTGAQKTRQVFSPILWSSSFSSTESFIQHHCCLHCRPAGGALQHVASFCSLQASQNTHDIRMTSYRVSCCMWCCATCMILSQKNLALQVFLFLKLDSKTKLQIKIFHLRVPE